MSLDYAILGFLNSAPLSGYDLKKEFDYSVQHFWAADQSQIYRVLARLRDKGFVTQELVEQMDRPDRKVYHITEKGREELANWLEEPVPFPPIRIGPMVQIFFGAQLSDEELFAIFKEQAEAMRNTLEGMNRIPRDPQRRDMNIFPTERDHYMSLLTLELGERIARTRLEFAKDVIQRIKDGELPQK